MATSTDITVSQTTSSTATSSTATSSTATSTVNITVSQIPTITSTATSITLTSDQVSQTSATPNETTLNSTATPSPKVHSLNLMSLAGGIVGGIAAFSIIVSMLFLYRRWRRSPTSSATSDPDIDQAQQPNLVQGTAILSLPEMATSSMRTYNPDDSTTFPMYLGVPNSRYIPVSAAPSSSGRNLYTFATLQNSQARGYHGPRRPRRRPPMAQSYPLKS